MVQKPCTRSAGSSEGLSAYLTPSSGMLPLSRIFFLMTANLYSSKVYSLLQSAVSGTSLVPLNMKVT